MTRVPAAIGICATIVLGSATSACTAAATIASPAVPPPPVVTALPASASGQRPVRRPSGQRVDSTPLNLSLRDPPNARSSSVSGSPMRMSRAGPSFLSTPLARWLRRSREWKHSGNTTPQQVAQLAPPVGSGTRWVKLTHHTQGICGMANGNSATVSSDVRTAAGKMLSPPNHQRGKNGSLEMPHPDGTRATDLIVTTAIGSIVCAGG